MIVSNSNVSTIFESLPEDECKVVFKDDVTIETLTKFLDKLVEQPATIQTKLRVSIKNLPVNLRQEVVRFAFTNTKYYNSTLLSNVICLIRNYNTFDQSFFDNELVFANNLSEVLDFKVNLKAEIKVFITELSKWYMSVFRSAHKIETNFLDKEVEMPTTYAKLIESLDFFTLSGIFAKCGSFSTDDLYLVKNGYDMLLGLSNKNIAASAFMAVIAGQLLEDDAAKAADTNKLTK